MGGDHIFTPLSFLGFTGGSEVKASACNVGDPGSIPGLGRSPGEGNGNPFQYSCLVNPMDGGAWWATVHGVAKSRSRLSDFTFTGLQSFESLRLSKSVNSLTTIENKDVRFIGWGRVSDEIDV